MTQVKTGHTPGFHLKACVGCRVLERSVIKLLQPGDHELVIYRVRALLSQAGFPVADEYVISAAASELATNIIRYAGSGSMEISLIEDRLDHIGVELFAMDHGPGIANLAAAMQENFSTYPNSLGLGLPSVQRIMDEFKIESMVGQGTRVLTRKWKQRG